MSRSVALQTVNQSDRGGISYRKMPSRRSLCAGMLVTDWQSVESSMNHLARHERQPGTKNSVILVSGMAHQVAGVETRVGVCGGWFWGSEDEEPRVRVRVCALFRPRLSCFFGSSSFLISGDPSGHGQTVKVERVDASAVSRTLGGLCPDQPSRPSRPSRPSFLVPRLSWH